MNRRQLRGLRELSYQLAAAQLQLLLPEDAREVTTEDVKRIEAEQEGYVLSGTTRVLAKNSSKWFYKQLKKERANGKKVS